MLLPTIVLSGWNGITEMNKEDEKCGRLFEFTIHKLLLSEDRILYHYGKREDRIQFKVASVQTSTNKVKCFLLLERRPTFKALLTLYLDFINLFLSTRTRVKILSMNLDVKWRQVFFPLWRADACGI